MPIRNLWTIPCIETISDANSGMTSLIHVIEYGQYDSFPAQMYPFHLVSRWTVNTTCTPEAITVVVTDMNGEENRYPITGQNGQKLAPMIEGTQTLDLTMVSIEAPCEGVYSLTIEITIAGKTYESAPALIGVLPRVSNPPTSE